MKTNYSEQLKSPKWQKKRLEIMKRDKFKCKLCGDEETTLNVHHKTYESGKLPWEYDNSNFLTLCEHCHHEISSEIKNENAEINYEQLKIYKSDEWVSGCRIMYMCYSKEKMSMTIYDKNNNYIVGFNIEDVISIEKIFKHYKKLGGY